MEFITSTQAAAHITALQDATVHRGLYPADGVLSCETKLQATAVSANQISIGAGVGVFQGRFFCIPKNTSDTVYITNGDSGYKRIDLICAQYTKNSTSGIEALNWVVKKGTPTTGTPARPSYNYNDLDSATVSELPVFAVNINGISISSIDLLLPIYGDMQKASAIIDGSAFLVEKKNTPTFSLAASGSINTSVNVSKAGYKPLAVVGYREVNDNRFFLYRLDLSGETATVYAKNYSTSALSNLYVEVQVLYLKL